MPPKLNTNEKQSSTQEWRNERRSVLKYMMALTAGVLAACLPNAETENNFDNPTAAPISTDHPTQAPAVTEAPAEVATAAPTEVPPTDLPTVEPTQAATAAPPPVAEVDLNYSCGPATGAAYIITSLCLRDRACIDVCPVEAIVPGFPIREWPMVYIDQDTCISCGACVPECPFAAIFPTEQVPSMYVARGGEYINRPQLTGHYEGTNHQGNPVVLDTVYQLQSGQVVDLTQDVGCNNAFFHSGPGYSARDHDNGM